MEFSIICQLDCRERNARGGWVICTCGIYRKMDHTATGHKSSLTSWAPSPSRETQALVFQTASMVNTLAESFLEFEQTHIALSVQFKDDMQEIYARVCLSETYTYPPFPGTDLTGFRFY